MNNLIYTGLVRENAKLSTLKYRSTGEVNDNGLVPVVHLLTGEEWYYTEQEYKTLFKIV